MRIEQVLADLGVPKAGEVFGPHWDESVLSLDPAGPWFLDPVEVRDALAYGGFTGEAETELLSQAARIRKDTAARTLIWHCHRLLFRHLDYDRQHEWPEDLGGAFFLLVALSMVKDVRALHASMGVADAVTRATCSQLSCFARNYAGMTGGGLGIPLRQVYWLRHYTAGRLFRVGRMEYMIRPFRGGAVAYRDRAAGAVVALAPHGGRYTEEGFCATAEDEGWTAALERDAEGVSGHPITPQGLADKRRVRLPAGRWSCVLDTGDPILEVHIPAGGDMGPEACGGSLRDALPFFRRHFPDVSPKGFACCSWILNPQLERIKLSTDNLVRFQRETYLFPVPSDGRDGLWFIFLTDNVDPATAPRDTSLRRGVADFLATGERWQSGAMFLLSEDVGAYGSGVYRARWPPSGLVWL